MLWLDVVVGYLVLGASIVFLTPVRGWVTDGVDDERDLPR